MSASVSQGGRVLCLAPLLSFNEGAYGKEKETEEEAQVRDS